MINLKIITPKRLLFEIKCLYVRIPGKTGEMQIYKGHTPLLSKLANGVLSLKNKENGIKNIAIEKGFVEINEKNVTVLTESAAMKKEINLEDEKKIIQQLKIKLNCVKNKKDAKVIQSKIEKSIAKCKVAS